jgi:beta-lactamase superfamily II metal-dependent hydrolase
MGIEIDFLPVGEASKSGDAIAIRMGNLRGPRSEQTVITIDGGTKESGANLVAHIKTHYGTSHVNFAFLSHPDGDHASGMSEILEKLTVGKVLMHRPWEHSEAIHDLFDDGRCTPDSISERSRANLAAAHEIEKLANQKGIEIIEPFAGVATDSGSIRVLGPTQEYYREVLAQFDYMPVLVEAKSAMATMFSAAVRAVNWLAERWDQDLLLEPRGDDTSAENNSSMILLLSDKEKHYLFTGDSGVVAISKALDYGDGIFIDWSKLTFMQTPHHGSRRNIGPSVLNRLFGGIQPVGTPQTKTTFVSAAKDGAPKHPNKRVTNAYLRRGVKSFVTAGIGVCHRDDAPDRVGWSAATPVPFHNQVEDDD